MFLQSCPINFIQVIYENINEMKINSKTLKYKITYTRLACKVQCEHTVYTTTLLEEEICKDIFISKQTTDNTNN